MSLKVKRPSKTLNYNKVDKVNAQDGKLNNKAQGNKGGNSNGT